MIRKICILIICILISSCAWPVKQYYSSGINAVLLDNGVPVKDVSITRTVSVLWDNSTYTDVSVTDGNGGFYFKDLSDIVLLHLPHEPSMGTKLTANLNGSIIEILSIGKSSYSKNSELYKNLIFVCDVTNQEKRRFVIRSGKFENGRTYTNKYYYYGRCIYNSG